MGKHSISTASLFPASTVTAREDPGGSRGGVKFPTGGDGPEWSAARERLSALSERVSRFGVTPKPTVRVRMEESDQTGVTMRVTFGSYRVP